MEEKKESLLLHLSFYGAENVWINLFESFQIII